MTVAWTDPDRRDPPIPPPAGRDGWIGTVVIVVWIVVVALAS